jgi:3,4-dihydroxy 2-butanone 4-phosphate synthase
MWSSKELDSAWSYRTVEIDSSLESAIESFTYGDPLLIHDATDRENEIDLVYPAYSVTPDDVARMRRDAGGLVCVALATSVAEAFNLSYIDELIDHPASENVELTYDDRSSFSLTVNHRDTHTGITDNDRAKTIAALGEAARKPGAHDFAETFHVPGHVHLLKAAPGHLATRRGHTELSVTLAELADIPPAVVVCEMLDERTGGSLSRTQAESYAANHGFVFLDGAEILAEVADN